MDSRIEPRRSPRRSPWLISSAIIAIGIASPASLGAVLIAFSNGDAFDGDTAGGTAGPFTDSVSGFSGVITTTGVTSGSMVSTHTNALGVHTNATTTAPSFVSPEFWTFQWDKATTFDAINLSASGGTEVFSVQSSAFVGKSITPGSVNVTFDSITGTFTFNSAQAGDDFSKANIYGALVDLPKIPANTNITFAGLSPTVGAAVQDMTWSIVPEPSSSLVLCAAGLAGIVRRKRQ